ncbi:hypothetical protein [Methylobacterium sp. J-068]|uniref:hypothetical protein n=1 Tax=Methylobacterium sp. J-068 TaxID=2836649 RepID=UPI001FB935B2|nr:hypothetical protein [Methylobacterium sp. J-068]MCJ2035945.1 hypothetical protein [Methylobacterium sp. J-068]
MATTVTQSMSAQEVATEIDSFYARNPQQTVGSRSRDIRTAYGKVSPLMRISIPFIKAAVLEVPRYGSKIAAGLDTVLLLADTACPVSDPAHGDHSVPRTKHLVSFPGESSEQTDYSSFRIENGYGLLNKVGISVAPGAEANIDVDFKTLTLTDRSVRQWFDSVKGAFEGAGTRALEEKHAFGGFSGSLLAEVFGCFFGDGTDDYYKNRSEDVELSNDLMRQDCLKALHQMQKTYIRLTGRMALTSTGPAPAEAFVFVETTTITFNDGTGICVVDTASPIVADRYGDTSEVSGRGTIRPLPIVG